MENLHVSMQWFITSQGDMFAGDNKRPEKNAGMRNIYPDVLGL
jgi:hypothetical protein